MKQYEIKNAEDWWKVADENWDNLMEVVFHTMMYDYPAHEIPGDGKSPQTGRTISEELEHLKATRRGHLLARYLNGAWGLASDAYAYSVPGWGPLCDLCSEEWALDEIPPGMMIMDD